MTLADLTTEMHRFVSAKGWHAPDSPRPQTPRNLAASLTIEATGNVKALPLAFQFAAHGGRIVCAGLWEQDVPIPISLEFLARELSLVAAHQPHCPISENLYWPWTQQDNRKLLLELMASGKLRVAEMLTHRFPAQDAPQVYQRIKLGDRDMLGVLLEWG